MDVSKWMVRKGQWGLWLIYPPNDLFVPRFAIAGADSFEEALILLRQLQLERYLRSKRWRDG